MQLVTMQMDGWLDGWIDIYFQLYNNTKTVVQLEDEHLSRRLLTVYKIEQKNTDVNIQKKKKKQGYSQ